MINPIEIKEQCTKWWKSLIIATINKESIFPKEIKRIGKPTVKYITEDYTNFINETKLLIKHSKNDTTNKKGYRLIFKEIKSNKIGNQSVINQIYIDSLDDFLKITKKEKEYASLIKNLELINKQLPILKKWLIQNPSKLISHITWTDTLKVCHYFLKNPQPNLYVRELPIEVHTKYIIENRSILESLLDFLIKDYTNPLIKKAKNERDFSVKFYLLHNEQQIRIRFLDKKLILAQNIEDMTIPISGFKELETNAKLVFVTENIKNFLTLPKLENTIALWSGGGFSVSYLKNIEWLKSKQFLYWGDLDAQGFHILHQFRTYFPTTITVMMDKETLSKFKAEKGEPTVAYDLPTLSEQELELYNYLRENDFRLEQEKIPNIYAKKEIEKVYENL